MRTNSTRWTWTVVTLGVFAVLGAASGSSSSSPTPSAPAAPAPVPGAAAAPAAPGQAAAAPSAPAVTPSPLVEVAARQYFNDYQANEVSADARYRGKRLRVTGRVSEIRRDMFDNIVLELRTSNRFMGVNVHLDDSQTARAAQVSRGQDIAVVGEGGGMIMGSPIVADAVIE
jgi:hypothetical protein